MYAFRYRPIGQDDEFYGQATSIVITLADAMAYARRLSRQHDTIVHIIDDDEGEEVCSVSDTGFRE